MGFLPEVDPLDEEGIKARSTHTINKCSWRSKRIIWRKPTKKKKKENEKQKKNCKDFGEVDKANSIIKRHHLTRRKALFSPEGMKGAPIPFERFRKKDL